MHIRIVQPTRATFAFQLILDDGEVGLSSGAFADRESAVRAVDALLAGLRQGASSLVAEGERYRVSIVGDDGEPVATSEPLPTLAEVDARLAVMRRWGASEAPVRIEGPAAVEPAAATDVDTGEYDLDLGGAAGAPGIELRERVTDGLHTAHLNDGEGRPLLVLRGFTSRAPRDRQVRSLLRAAVDVRRVDRRADGGGLFFVVKARNGAEIARSRWFAAAQGREAAIAWMMSWAVDARERGAALVEPTAREGGAGAEEAAPAKERAARRGGYDLERRSTSGEVGVERFQAAGGEHFFHVNDASGAALLFSHGYKSARSRDRGVDALARAAVDAERYRVAAQGGHFTIVAGNGREIVRSRELSGDEAIASASAWTRRYFAGEVDGDEEALAGEVDGDEEALAGEAGEVAGSREIGEAPAGDEVAAAPVSDGGRLVAGGASAEDTTRDAEGSRDAEGRGVAAAVVAGVSAIEAEAAEQESVAEGDEVEAADAGAGDDAAEEQEVAVAGAIAAEGGASEDAEIVAGSDIGEGGAAAEGEVAADSDVGADDGDVDVEAAGEGDVAAEGAEGVALEAASGDAVARAAVAAEGAADSREADSEAAEKGRAAEEEVAATEAGDAGSEAEAEERESVAEGEEIEAAGAGAGDEATATARIEAEAEERESVAEGEEVEAAEAGAGDDAVATARSEAESAERESVAEGEEVEAAEAGAGDDATATARREAEAEERESVAEGEEVEAAEAGAGDDAAEDDELTAAGVAAEDDALAAAEDAEVAAGSDISECGAAAAEEVAADLDDGPDDRDVEVEAAGEGDVAAEGAGGDAIEAASGEAVAHAAVAAEGAEAAAPSREGGATSEEADTEPATAREEAARATSATKPRFAASAPGEVDYLSLFRRGAPARGIASPAERGVAAEALEADASGRLKDRETAAEGDLSRTSGAADGPSATSVEVDVGDVAGVGGGTEAGEELAAGEEVTSGEEVEAGDEGEGGTEAPDVGASREPGVREENRERVEAAASEEAVAGAEGEAAVGEEAAASEDGAAQGDVDASEEREEREEAEASEEAALREGGEAREGAREEGEAGEEVDLREEAPLRAEVELQDEGEAGEESEARGEAEAVEAAEEREEAEEEQAGEEVGARVEAEGGASRDGVEASGGAGEREVSEASGAEPAKDPLEDAERGEDSGAREAEPAAASEDPGTAPRAEETVVTSGRTRDDIRRRLAEAVARQRRARLDVADVKVADASEGEVSATSGEATTAAGAPAEVESAAAGGSTEQRSGGARDVAGDGAVTSEDGASAAASSDDDQTSQGAGPAQEGRGRAASERSGFTRPPTPLSPVASSDDEQTSRGAGPAQEGRERAVSERSGFTRPPTPVSPVASSDDVPRRRRASRDTRPFIPPTRGGAAERDPSVDENAAARRPRSSPPPPPQARRRSPPPPPSSASSRGAEPTRRSRDTRPILPASMSPADRKLPELEVDRGPFARHRQRREVPPSPAPRAAAATPAASPSGTRRRRLELPEMPPRRSRDTRPIIIRSEGPEELTPLPPVAPGARGRQRAVVDRSSAARAKAAEPPTPRREVPGVTRGGAAAEASGDAAPAAADVDVVAVASAAEEVASSPRIRPVSSRRHGVTLPQRRKDPLAPAPRAADAGDAPIDRDSDTRTTLPLDAAAPTRAASEPDDDSEPAQRDIPTSREEGPTRPYTREEVLEAQSAALADVEGDSAAPQVEDVGASANKRDGTTEASAVGSEARTEAVETPARTEAVETAATTSAVGSAARIEAVETPARTEAVATATRTEAAATRESAARTEAVETAARTEAAATRESGEAVGTAGAAKGEAAGTRAKADPAASRRQAGFDSASTSASTPVAARPSGDPKGRPPARGVPAAAAAATSAAKAARPTTGPASPPAHKIHAQRDMSASARAEAAAAAKPASAPAAAVAAAGERSPAARPLVAGLVLISLVVVVVVLGRPAQEQGHEGQPMSASATQLRSAPSPSRSRSQDEASRAEEEPPAQEREAGHEAHGDGAAPPVEEPTSAPQERPRGGAEASPRPPIDLSTCRDTAAPELGIAVVPAAPVADRELRILAATLAAESAIDVQLLRPDGEAASAAVEVMTAPGVPSYAVLTWTTPSAGTYRVAVRSGDAAPSCLSVEVAAEGTPAATPPEGLLWESERVWTAGEEALYSAWIRHLFADDALAGRDVAGLDALTSDPARNLLYAALGLGEDRSPEEGGLALAPDGPDLAYFLRGYWSWKRRLPFAFRVCSRETARAAPRCKPPRSNLSAAFGEAGRGDELSRIQRLFARTLTLGIHSGNAGVALGDSASDFYPVRIDRASLRPGAIYADPYGHIFVITELRAATEGEPAALVAVDSEADGALAAKPFSEATFLWAAGERPRGAAFKRFRPALAYGEAIVEVADDELGALAGRDDLWRGYQEFESDAAFYAAVRELYDPPPWDPKAQLRQAVESLAELVRARVDAVERGVAATGRRRGAVKMPRDAQLFDGRGAWQELSTPARDLRILAAIDVVLGVAARVRAEPERFLLDGDVDATVAGLSRELDALLRDPAYSVRYGRSDGSEWTLTLADVVERSVALERAYNPNDCAEIRWGAASESDEASTCDRRAAPEQRARMERYRGWFRERRLPARGEKAP
ncbi:MAG: hypothetical protein R3A79_31080 [Nannocystaceae bacterium]